MICPKVLDYTPGKRVSTEVPRGLELSPYASIVYWVGYDVPRCLWSNCGCSGVFVVLNWANWVPTLAIVLVAVEFGRAGWVPGGGQYWIGWVLEWWGCKTGELGELTVGWNRGLFRSSTNTLSIMSSLWARSSSRIVERLMERPEDGVERWWVLDVLGVLCVSGCSSVVSCEVGLPLSVLVWLAGEWLYSLKLVLGSTLLVTELSVCMPVWVCSWLYLLGGWRLHVFLRIPLVELRVSAALELPLSVDALLGAMVFVNWIGGMLGSDFKLVIRWLFG